MELRVEKQSKQSEESINPNSWVEVDVPERIDAFTFKEFKAQVESKLASGEKFLALNFSNAEFLSLLTIKFIISVADELLTRDGQLAVVGVSEKLKRQISIYASVKPLMVVSSFSKLA